MDDGTIVYSAPGRCGIVGNPSDMYGGSVISCSTVERARVTVTAADVCGIEVGGERRTVQTAGDLVQDGGMFDAVLAAMEYFDLDDCRLNIRVESDIPLRAGLSGSTAVMTALTAALLEWMDVNHIRSDVTDSWGVRAYHNPYLLAEIVRHIELYFLKIVCGYQDAYMCAFGSLNLLDFRDKEHYLSLNREPLGMVENLAPLAPPVPVILAHTGVQRVSGSVHKPIRDRWIEGEPLVVQAMLRLGHLARMSKKAVLLGDWDMLGGAMIENHQIARSIGSSSEINEAVIAAAVDAGAIAAKLAGAGKGGTIMALHPDPQSLEEPLRAAGAQRFLYPSPGDGVRREDGV